ncbi:dNTP triphosphohydrolase [Lentisphaera profundi]|uniref:DNTP triphosphohydrolase n=1 Tax=Lentisphaera profundi TaxID=1658616 RepID=A0ABY7VZU2_9BACT|nr:dNTP triphosphohydrolase [Lentisphaera profundi]WDE98244.1 dNTP triphosphohydrolase [Lentisphaera profundi]
MPNVYDQDLIKSFWPKLMCPVRMKDIAHKREPLPNAYSGARTAFESDHDRILFSTPFRRLIDKTQVFPLEKKYDTIRRRLTHSYEVSSLARSFGNDLVFNSPELFPDAILPQRNIPVVLATIGLVHDMGNPPFGHEGESAIQYWFRRRLEAEPGLFKGFTEQQQQDFLKFEGNAQTVRIVTHLQVLNDLYGLNLTLGTLSALLKYIVPSHKVNKKQDLAKGKFGYFASEKAVIDEIESYTGLHEQRNPLTYIMEACDDIAYSVLDIEDAVKKGVISYADIISFLKSANEEDPDEHVSEVINRTSRDYGNYSDIDDLSYHELNDIAMVKFRVYAINTLMQSARQAFTDNYMAILKGEFKQDLLVVCGAKRLSALLKKFCYRHIYRNRDVLGLELQGFNTITGLLDIFWEAINDCEDKGELASPYSKYVFERISENYRRVFHHAVQQGEFPEAYCRMQLMTDMLSGMTDTYAVTTYEDLLKRKQ